MTDAREETTQMRGISNRKKNDKKASVKRKQVVQFRAPFKFRLSFAMVKADKKISNSIMRCETV
jgi:hypothetical protein